MTCVTQGFFNMIILVPRRCITPRQQTHPCMYFGVSCFSLHTGLHINIVIMSTLDQIWVTKFSFEVLYQKWKVDSHFDFKVTI